MEDFSNINKSIGLIRASEHIRARERATRDPDIVYPVIRMSFTTRVSDTQKAT